MPFSHPPRMLSPLLEDPTPEDLNRQKVSTLWFPPPPALPTSVTIPTVEEERTVKRPKASSLPTSKNRKRVSFRHSIGLANQARKKRLGDPQLPAIKLTLQHWILLCLLLLSFLVLICGFIFAGCVALPHTDKNDKNSTDVSTGIETFDYEITVFRRQEDIESDVRSAAPPDTITPQLSDILDSGNAREAGDTLANATAGAEAGATGTTTINLPPAANQTADDYLNDEAKRLGYDSPKNLLILFLYIATLPILTILHTTTELITLCCAGRRSSNPIDDDEEEDFIAKLKARTQSPDLRPRSLKSKLLSRTALTLTTCVLLVCGWTVANAIQLQCEIPHPSFQSADHQAICPVQIRGHFMHGIHELSIVRNVFGWLVITVYVIYGVWCWRVGSQGNTVNKQVQDRIRTDQELEAQRELALNEKKSGTAAVVRFAAQRDLSPVRE